MKLVPVKTGSRNPAISTPCEFSGPRFLSASGGFAGVAIF